MNLKPIYTVFICYLITVLSCKEEPISVNPITHCGASSTVSCCQPSTQNANKPISQQANNLTVPIRFFVLTQPDTSMVNLLNRNMELLNEHFGGYITFRNDSMIYFIDEAATIDDLFEDWRLGGDRLYRMADQYEEAGWLNVFVGNSDADAVRELLGFTPVYASGYESLETVSPRMDKVFVSMNGIEKGSTLSHEIGHLFGLSHPWEYLPEDAEILELNEQSTCRNLMNYNCYVDQFTDAQLSVMMEHLGTWRGYLVE